MSLVDLYEIAAGVVEHGNRDRPQVGGRPSEAHAGPMQGLIGVMQNHLL
jgi:hypothetical protein